ncbi:MAG: hypothetical protein CM1200mP2_17640 [Planctomycetaceae bacterium]|nr:MAG: hypothetical protein CM1200mP2_17640 [Planctomycetaceae bacterium]
MGGSDAGCDIDDPLLDPDQVVHRQGSHGAAELNLGGNHVGSLAAVYGGDADDSGIQGIGFPGDDSLGGKVMIWAAA